MKAYIYEVYATNTGFFVVDTIIHADDEIEIENYFNFNFDNDYYDYCFNSNDLAILKSTKTVVLNKDNQL